jgi:two-component system CheB/CheR fusion protein
VQAVYCDYQAVFAARGVALLSESPTEPVWAAVDLDRLDQALSNLLSNGLKFTDRGGSVVLGLDVESHGHFAVISVTDNGIGMTPDVIETLFQLHAHESSPRNRAGLGLGLPLAKSLIELHGGRLEVESHGLGRGASFRVLIPLSTKPR